METIDNDNFVLNAKVCEEVPLSILEEMFSYAYSSHFNEDT